MQKAAVLLREGAPRGGGLAPHRLLVRGLVPSRVPAVGRHDPRRVAAAAQVKRSARGFGRRASSPRCLKAFERPAAVERANERALSMHRADVLPRRRPGQGGGLIAGGSAPASARAVHAFALVSRRSSVMRRAQKKPAWSPLHTTPCWSTLRPSRRHWLSTRCFFSLCTREALLARMTGRRTVCLRGIRRAARHRSIRDGFIEWRAKSALERSCRP